MHICADITHVYSYMHTPYIQGVESILWDGFDDNVHLLYAHDYSFVFNPVGIVASGILVTIYGENGNTELSPPNEPDSPAR